MLNSECGFAADRNFSIVECLFKRREAQLGCGTELAKGVDRGLSYGRVAIVDSVGECSDDAIFGRSLLAQDAGCGPARFRIGTLELCDQFVGTVGAAGKREACEHRERGDASAWFSFATDRSGDGRVRRTGPGE